METTCPMAQPQTPPAESSTASPPSSPGSNSTPSYSETAAAQDDTSATKPSPTDSASPSKPHTASSLERNSEQSASTPRKPTAIDPAERPLLRIVATAADHADQRRQLDAIHGDVTPMQAVRLAARSLPGDEQAQRMLPTIARGIAGAIPGTNPESAALRAAK